MRERVKPRIFMRHAVFNKLDVAGYIQLVEYYSSSSIPHIEYDINEEFRNRGIMSRELPKYLKKCKKYGHNKLLAVTESSNVISQKLLEKNGFLKLLGAHDYVSYIVDLSISRKDIQFILDNMPRNIINKPLT